LFSKTWLATFEKLDVGKERSARLPLTLSRAPSVALADVAYHFECLGVLMPRLQGIARMRSIPLQWH